MEKRPRIFSTDKGVVIIKSAAKNEIIDLLKDKEMNSSQIREELDKAKSTISVHLSDLKDLGIIEEKQHPEDERKKLFYLSSQIIGKSENPFDKHYKDILENIGDSKGEKYEFLKSLFHLIRYGLISFGLDIHPALKEIGRDAGKSIGKNFDVNDREELFSEIDDFWKNTGLGSIELNENGYLLINNCFDCGEMPDVGETLCSLDEGMIEGIIEETVGEKVTLSEVECHGTGADHCKFKIE